MNRICSLFVVLIGSVVAVAANEPAVSPNPKSLTVPDEELSKAREFVRQLADEEFADRERAEAELAKMGRLARIAILEGATGDPSPEVRNRCQLLLPKATSLEMQARLAVFLADAEGKFEHDLPGWNEFRETVRADWYILGHKLRTDRSLDQAARQVFAEIISSPINRFIMFAVGSQSMDINSLAGARRQELYSQKYPRSIVINGMVQRAGPKRDPSLTDILTLLFVESQTSSKYVPPRTASISVLISSSGLTTVARGTDPKSRVYQAIAAAWLDTRWEPVDMQNAMTIATNLGMTDQSVRLALRLFESKSATVYYRGNAAATLARTGDKTLIPRIAKAMDDKTVLTTIRKNMPGKPVNEWPTFEVQIRDVALAVSIILAGRNPTEFGFTDQQSGATVNYSYTRYYLTEESRKEAFEKWKEFRAKNP